MGCRTRCGQRANFCVVPRKEALGDCTHLTGDEAHRWWGRVTATVCSTASPLPSPRERLRAVGGVRGGGTFWRIRCLTTLAPHPARRLRRRATLPTASRGEGWCPRHCLGFTRDVCMTQ